MSTEIKIKEIEVSKLNMQPGEILVVKLKGQQFLEDVESMDALQAGLAQMLPNNKIVVLGIPDEHELNMEILSNVGESTVQSASQSVGCGTEPSAYCGSCNCGKKEAWEAKQQKTSTSSFDGLTSEELTNLEEAAIKNALNFGAPEQMWDDEGNCLMKDGKLTEKGIEFMRKSYEEKNKKDGDNS